MFVSNDMMVYRRPISWGWLCDGDDWYLHGHHAGELCVEIVRRRAQWRSGRDFTPVVVGNVLPDQTNKKFWEDRLLFVYKYYVMQECLETRRRQKTGCQTDAWFFGALTRLVSCYEFHRREDAEDGDCMDTFWGELQPIITVRWLWNNSSVASVCL